VRHALESTFGIPGLPDAVSVGLLVESAFEKVLAPVQLIELFFHARSQAVRRKRKRLPIHVAGLAHRPFSGPGLVPFLVDAESRRAFRVRAPDLPGQVNAAIFAAALLELRAAQARAQGELALLVLVADHITPRAPKLVPFRYADIAEITETRLIELLRRLPPKHSVIIKKIGEPMIAGGVEGFLSRGVEIGFLLVQSVRSKFVADLARRVPLVVCQRVAGPVGVCFLCQVTALVVPKQPAIGCGAAGFDLGRVTELVISEGPFALQDQLSLAVRFEISPRDYLAKLIVTEFLHRPGVPRAHQFSVGPEPVCPAHVSRRV